MRERLARASIDIPLALVISKGSGGLECLVRSLEDATPVWLWVQSSLAQKQRLQQVFFPDGVRFDGKALVGTGTTLPVFNYLNPISDGRKELVDQTGVELY